MKPTVFFVTDVETTLKNRIAFDVAWKAVDRKGHVYCEESFLVKEAFKLDVPYFKEKLGFYFEHVYHGRIVPSNIVAIRDRYCAQVSALQNTGHRVILCAYNAAFDFERLPETFEAITGQSIDRWSAAPMLDIWHYWGASVPKVYRDIAPRSEKGNLRTTAQAAYAFESQNPGFIESHIAFEDVEIECAILLRALSRKKRLPVVNRTTQFRKNVWRDINARL